jgi:hypothetical protein
VALNVAETCGQLWGWFTSIPVTKIQPNGMISSGWWLTKPSEKYESVSWDDYSQYMENTKMFQTTNQTNIPSDSNTWLAGKSSTKIWRFDGNIIKLNAGCSSRLTDFRRIYQP